LLVHHQTLLFPQKIISLGIELFLNSMTQIAKVSKIQKQKQKQKKFDLKKKIK
jgi:hypothetical protein